MVEWSDPSSEGETEVFELSRRMLKGSKRDAYSSGKKTKASPLLNSKTKTWPSCIILMQMVWYAHNNNVEIGIRHEFREENKWSDQLAGGDAKDFDPLKRLRPTMDKAEWDLLNKFTKEEILATITRSEE